MYVNDIVLTEESVDVHARRAAAGEGLDLDEPRADGGRSLDAAGDHRELVALVGQRLDDGHVMQEGAAAVRPPIREVEDAHGGIL